MFRHFRAPARRRPRGQAIVEFTLVLPVLLLLLLAIGDFARVFATALTVEAAVREGADYGSFETSNWIDTGTPPTNAAKTMDEIQHRVCEASSTLPDYESTSPTNETCTNPAVAIELIKPSGPTQDCSVTPLPAGQQPCMVHVRGTYTFHLFLPGVTVGNFSFPTTLPITREAYFVVNDFLTP
jgi:Flp pilus assembly protein TadG